MWPLGLPSQYNLQATLQQSVWIKFCLPCKSCHHNSNQNTNICYVNGKLKFSELHKELSYTQLTITCCATRTAMKCWQQLKGSRNQSPDYGVKGGSIAGGNPGQGTELGFVLLWVKKMQTPGTESTWTWQTVLTKEIEKGLPNLKKQPKIIKNLKKPTGRSGFKGSIYSLEKKKGSTSLLCNGTSITC